MLFSLTVKTPLARHLHKCDLTVTHKVAIEGFINMVTTAFNRWIAILIIIYTNSQYASAIRNLDHPY